MYAFALASLPHRKFKVIVISAIVSFWIKANVCAFITIQNQIQTSVKPDEVSLSRHSEFFLLETEAVRSSRSSVFSCLDPWGK